MSDGWAAEGYPSNDPSDVPDVFDPAGYPDVPPVEPSAAERSVKTKSADGSGKGKSPDGSGKGPSQATELVELAKERYRVFRGEDGKTYAVEHDRPGIALPLRRDGVKEQMAAVYFRTHRRAASGSALSDMLTVLAGEALETAPEPVAIRVARYEGRVYLDLGTADARAVEVDRTGWRLVSSSPALFRRTESVSPLPAPAASGSLDGLRSLLNVSESGFRLVVGWLLAALIPDIGHPILALTGQQGTAKTTAARIVLSMIDPSPGGVDSPPTDAEGWAVKAYNSHAVGLDNVSRLAPWFQDALCRAVTGESFARRARYSDDTITYLTFRSPIVITSIDPGALQGDVADRLLPITLDPLAGKYRPESEIMAEVDAARPGALGALLSMLAKVLDALPTVTLDDTPRMADFARVLAALDVVTGWTTLADYLDAARTAAQNVTEADSFATAVRDLIDARGRWEGTPAELLAELTGEGRQPADWPKTAQAVAGKLSRLTPALKASGVMVEKLAHSRRGTPYLLSTIAANVCDSCRLPLTESDVLAGYRTHVSCDF
ncbi:ATP-binding protein [Rathayibacter sp. AY1C4]|uniref:ATP-binding protein n=1 Tax=Rathayibacter sp. AY1C4 TaxID=2080537 RepID=UPI0015E33FA2|nr:ATP-binding protein [Rathayibacter sp. AY1C4]